MPDFSVLDDRAMKAYYQMRDEWIAHDTSNGAYVMTLAERDRIVALQEIGQAAQTLKRHATVVDELMPEWKPREL